MFADDLVVIAETEDDLIKRLNEWKDNVENTSMRVNMNKTKVMISYDWFYVPGFTFLVLAHPGSPGHNQRGPQTVLCVCYE